MARIEDNPVFTCSNEGVLVLIRIIRGQADLERGEQKLMFAVIEQALADFLSAATPQSRPGYRDLVYARRSAHVFLSSRLFEEMCDSVGVASDWIWRLLNVLSNAGKKGEVMDIKHEVNLQAQIDKLTQRLEEIEPRVLRMSNLIGAIYRAARTAVKGIYPGIIATEREQIIEDYEKKKEKEKDKKDDDSEDGGSD